MPPVVVPILAISVAGLAANAAVDSPTASAMTATIPMALGVRPKWRCGVFIFDEFYASVAEPTSLYPKNVPLFRRSRRREFSDECCVERSLPVACREMAKSALGKGLGALISARPVPARFDLQPGEKVHQTSLSDIVPSPLQPRKEFERDALQ